MVRRGRDATRGPSPQLLSLLRIHGQHGNAVYKGGLKQESEQCLTTTVTNSGEITLDTCKKNTSLTELRFKREKSLKNHHIISSSVSGWIMTPENKNKKTLLKVFIAVVYST